jgi:hypothetical protein
MDVTKVSAQSVTVQITGTATNTLTLTDKTTLKQAGKAAQLSDLHVGVVSSSTCWRKPPRRC